MKKKKNPLLFNEDEEVYVGNVWGWKFSFISLALILGLAILMWVKHCELEKKKELPQEENIYEGRLGSALPAYIHIKLL